MDKCDFCAIRYECIGFFPNADGTCAGFYVDPALKQAYENHLLRYLED